MSKIQIQDLKFSIPRLGEFSLNDLTKLTDEETQIICGGDDQTVDPPYVFEGEFWLVSDKTGNKLFKISNPTTNSPLPQGYHFESNGGTICIYSR
jgi:hypothetical protein